MSGIYFIFFALLVASLVSHVSVFSLVGLQIDRGLRSLLVPYRLDIYELLNRTAYSITALLLNYSKEILTPSTFPISAKTLLYSNALILSEDSNHPFPINTNVMIRSL